VTDDEVTDIVFSVLSNAVLRIDDTSLKLGVQQFEYSEQSSTD